MSMRRALSSLTAPIGLAVLLVSSPAAAQQPGAAATKPAAAPAAMPTSGYRAEVINDLNELEKKFLGLADAMKGKYAWRPMAGVRSVGEVFGHIAGDQMVLPAMVGYAPPPDMQAEDMRGMFGKVGEMEKVTDPATIRANIVRSFAHARAAVASISDAQLDDKVFGQDMTKRAMLNLLVTHTHEHLGQSIAYARSNGVTPPWSAGGGE